jgi:hypothetical protein
MITRIEYNCNPESLGEMDAAAFVDAFENECTARLNLQNADIEVTFKAGKSQLVAISSDDQDDAENNAWREQWDDTIADIAEKAFTAICNA